MNRIFITGDTHGSLELKRLSNKNFPLAKTLTKEDVVIICGDAGFMWNSSNETKYWDDWAEDRPFTIISVFGNHSNYDALRAIPITEWQGAKVHAVRPHVMYIENGEIFTLNNKTFFCMGGARSIDKAYRIEGKSWWPEEIASYQEMEHGINNLEKYNFNVDYILAHCAPNHIVDILYPYENQHDTMTSYLEHVCQRTIFNKFFCGHYHVDRSYDDQKYNIIYNDILEIMPDGRWEIIA